MSQLQSTDCRLEAADWKSLRAAHEARVDTLLGDDVDRRQANRKHPVHDFLFEYYSFRVGHLRRWTPGPGVFLEGATADDFPFTPWFTVEEGGVWLDPSRLLEKRRTGFRWILGLLEATRDRPPVFGCYGLHEWAMVYRSGEIRHGEPLRLPPEEIAAFVESRSVCCTHFDAFRFFTEAARPLNRWQLDRETRPEMEQRGCIHATMDLYKWAYKLHPWIASELVADAFELAVAARAIDMKASPYDLRHYGYEPIRIETAEGRQEYEQAQRGLAEWAVPLRERLIDAYRKVT